MKTGVLRTIYIDPWMDDVLRAEARRTKRGFDAIINKYLKLGMNLSETLLIKSKKSK